MVLTVVFGLIGFDSDFDHGFDCFFKLYWLLLGMMFGQARALVSLRLRWFKQLNLGS